MIVCLQCWHSRKLPLPRPSLVCQLHVDAMNGPESVVLNPWFQKQEISSPRLFRVPHMSLLNITPNKTSIVLVPTRWFSCSSRSATPGACPEALSSQRPPSTAFTPKHLSGCASIPTTIRWSQQKQTILPSEMGFSGFSCCGESAQVTPLAAVNCESISTCQESNRQGEDCKPTIAT